MGTDEPSKQPGDEMGRRDDGATTGRDDDEMTTGDDAPAGDGTTGGENIGKPSKQHAARDDEMWDGTGQIGETGTRTEPPRYRNRETSQDIGTIKTLQSKTGQPRNRDNQSSRGKSHGTGQATPRRRRTEPQ